MKSFPLLFSAVATALALGPLAFAGPLSLNQITSPYVLTSEDAADVGSDLSLVNAVITNNSAQSIAITGIEFYLGGTGVPGAAGDTPSEFTAAANGWTYALGDGTYSNLAGSGWSKNSVPTPGDAVQPKDGSTKDYLSEVTLVNSNASGYCYIDEILAAGGDCDVELLVTPNYGGAQGTSPNTFIYGYAEGVEGKGTFTPSNNGSGGSWSSGADATVAQGMQEQVEIDVAPEPGSMVLLGTGVGLLGLGAFLRRRDAMARLTAA